ncbi:hypothetical protein R0G64_32695, partial [Pseudomonas otitidis]
EGKLPDVLLVDGGKGQLAMAREVLQELAVPELILLGVGDRQLLPASAVGPHPVADAEFTPTRLGNGFDQR